LFIETTPEKRNKPRNFDMPSITCELPSIVSVEAPARLIAARSPVSPMSAVNVIMYAPDPSRSAAVIAALRSARSPAVNIVVKWLPSLRNLRT